MPSLEPRWLSSRDTADYIGVRVGDLARLVKQGTIPEPSHTLGPRQPRWDRLALDAKMEGQATSETFDEAAERIAREMLQAPSRRRRRAAGPG